MKHSKYKSKKKNVDPDDHRFHGKNMLDWSMDLPPADSSYMFIYCDEHFLHWSLIRRGNAEQATSWRTEKLQALTTNHQESSEMLGRMMPKGIQNYLASLDTKSKSQMKQPMIYIYYLDPAAHACTNENRILPTMDDGRTVDSQSILLSKLFASTDIICRQYFLTQDDFYKLSESLSLNYNTSLDFYEYSCFQYCSMKFQKPFLMVYSHFQLPVTSIIHFEPKGNPQDHSVINIQRFHERLSENLGVTSDIAKSFKAFTMKNCEIYPDTSSSPVLALVGNSVSRIKHVLGHSDEWKHITCSFDITCLKRAFSLGIHSLFDAKRDDLTSMLDSSIDESHQTEMVSALQITKQTENITKRKVIEGRVRIAKDFLGIGISYGTVKGLDVDKDGNEIWFIQYDDGDSEDFTSSDLEMARFFYDSFKGAQAIKKIKHEKRNIVESQVSMPNKTMEEIAATHMESVGPPDSLGLVTGTNVHPNEESNVDDDDFHDLEVHI